MLLEKKKVVFFALFVLLVVLTVFSFSRSQGSSWIVTNPDGSVTVREEQITGGVRDTLGVHYENGLVLSFDGLYNDVLYGNEST